ncbi:MAG: HAD family hydrolase [Nanoarchaeota archaeon]|nr:HAD family hydrolase [Nanoarchaeota archaeon]
MKSKKDGITHIIFDVDGTLYDKKREYVPGKGSIEDAHEFFRYNTFSKASEDRIFNQKELINKIIEEYQQKARESTLIKAIESYPSDLKMKYKNLVKKHGSNGKVFVNEFGTDSSFFAKIVGQVDFEEILTKDIELQNMVQTLKQKGYNLGILTTEIYDTVKKVSNIMGIPLEDFELETGTPHPILCAENVKEKKPSPEGFNKILKIIQPNSPENIIYVGDHFKKDIEASLNCGLNAIHVTNDRTGNISLESCQTEHGQRKFIKVDKIYQLTDIL